MANNIKGITVEIGGNTGPLQTALKDVNKTADSLQSELNQVNRQLKFDPGSTVLLTQKQNLAALSTDALKEKQAALKEAVSQVQAQFAEDGKNADKVRAVEREYERVTQQIEQLKTQAASVSSVLGVQMEQTAKKISDAGKGISSVGEKISGVGQTLTMGVTLPIVGLGVAAAKTGMDFEAQMSRVQAVSGATSSQLKTLTDTAMDLGQKTTYSDQQVAEGMENLAQAGFSANEVVQAMPGMLNLAASSGEDLASSADIAASTLRGFGLAADQAGHVADVLAKNAAQTNAAVSDTGLAMKYIAPLALNAGWSLEQTTAAIGEMSNAGIKGEKAGTTLRGALTNLIAPSKEQAAAMKEVGLNVYDANGKMNSLSNIIGQLQTGTSKMSDAQRDNAVATIMGSDALSGMQVLIQDGSGALDTMTQSLKDSDGASQDMANTMMDNTKGSIEQMKGSVENAGIALSKVMSPAVRDAADKITDLANKFADLSPKTQETVVKFGLMAAVTGPVVLGFGKTTEAIGKTVTSVGAGVKGVGNLIKGLSGVVPAADEAVPAMQAFGLALATNPAAQVALAIGLVAAGVAAVVVAIQNYKTPNQEFINELQGEEKAWKDVKKAADDKSASDLAEIDNTQTLWNQLNTLVDTNGKVIGDNRTKVQELIDLINSAAGKTMLTMIDGQITRWGEAKDAVDKYIKSQQAQILLDAHKEEYKKALSDWEGAVSKVSETKKKIAADQAEIEKWENTPSTQQVNSHLKVKQYQDDLNSLQKNLSDYSAMAKDKLENISSFQNALAANTEGDYDKVNQILGASVIRYKESTGATREQLGQQVLDMKNSMDLIVEWKKSGEANVSDAQIQAMQQRYNDAQTEYDKAVGQAGNAAKLTGETYSGNLSATAGLTNSAGQQVAQWAVNGLTSKAAEAASAGKSLAENFADAFQSFNATVAGETIGQNVIDGINSKLNRVELGGGLTGYRGSGITLTPYARGTNFFPGGAAITDEEGGEIKVLPTGTQIWPHDISEAYAKGLSAAGAQNISKPDINLNFYGESHFGTVSETKSNLQQAQFAAGLS